MANMDYPGPCMSCSAIEGCSTEESRKMSIASYCKGLDMELNAWKAQLYDVLIQAENITSENRADFDDHMNLIKSIIRELETINDKIRDECPLDMGTVEQEVGTRLGKLRTKYSDALSLFSPGYLGG